MLPNLLRAAHLIGIVVGVGAATVKLALLVKVAADNSFADMFVKASRPITRLIIAGLVLTTASGVGWTLALKYPLTPHLFVKAALVASVWVLGPVIDNIVEPKFNALVPSGPSPAFTEALRRYLAFEAVATGLFYCTILYWVLF